MRIAMWSGPRNLSTAMMYSFASRPDCAVWDEPFYAAYLEATGLRHPMRDEIIEVGEVDPQCVAHRCRGLSPDGSPVFFQKHMVHHMMPEFDRNWIRGMVNIFLIRHPARVIASYHAKRENPTIEDIGFQQQGELFDHLCQQTGTAPLVIDSFDVRAKPEPTLRLLCRAIGLPFDSEMLHWAAGGNEADGVWAPHWYGAVWKSTKFAQPESGLPDIPETLAPVLEQALPSYERMSLYKVGG